MRHIFSNLSLQTKLLFMMTSLCALLIAFLLVLYTRAEKDLIEEVRHHTEELSTAIQVSIEQISSKSNEEASLDKFKGLMNIKKKGIKEISVINNTRDVIASSNASLIGRKLQLKGESVRSFGNVTEYTTTTGGQKIYDILLPVVIGKERLGYIHIETQFDDFTSIARENNRNRLVAALVIFSIGILLAVYLSKKYTEPIQSIVDAAQKVAGGNLSIKLKVERSDEIGRLMQNFNEMVRKLNENRALQAKLKEAEHMSKIGTLASGIAHEVRNPLNLINLSIDHLRAMHTPEDEGREGFLKTVANIKSEIERLDGMVSNFLNFGRPINLDPKEMAIEPVIQETLALIADRCAEQKIRTELRAATVKNVSIDYRHIKTCLLNIFLNAVQAMPEGGRLTVELTGGNDLISIRAEDTGVGIEPADLPKVFDPYFTTKDIGIGLGLAFTKRIIDEHGGKIHITSIPGRGTAVTVHLPAIAGA